MAELTGSDPEPLAVQWLPARPAEFVPEPIPEDLVLKVRNLMGIKKETWDRDMVEAIRTVLPRFGLTKVVARVCLRTGFESLEHAAKVIEMARELMETEKITEMRIASGKTVSIAVEAMGKMFPQLMELAEKAADKYEGDDGGKRRPQNLPPSVTANVQVNVGGAPSPAPPIPVGAVVKSGSGPKNKPPANGSKR